MSRLLPFIGLFNLDCLCFKNFGGNSSAGVFTCIVNQCPRGAKLTPWLLPQKIFLYRIRAEPVAP